MFHEIHRIQILKPRFPSQNLWISLEYTDFNEIHSHLSDLNGETINDSSLQFRSYGLQLHVNVADAANGVIVNISEYLLYTQIFACK